MDASSSVGHDIKLSKSLSWLLRHGAYEAGIVLDKEGFASVADVLKLPQFSRATVADVEHVVASNDKQRFCLKSSNDGRLLIGANQGHSLRVENLQLEIQEAGGLRTIVHGSYFRNWPSIKTQGLSRMGRQHIHFAPEVQLSQETRQVVSGMRKGCDLIISVDLETALKNGYNFYRSQNNVILCPGNADGVLEPKYFSSVVHKLRNGTEDRLL